ncbi:hypothetical protein EJ05DRAFT_505090 [Pseudovirgaria hyperparasitica]|uniref:Rhodopsin domain-containing protein n=1 Tax=Pseudovirgaria hyperparasitica TaxID=470096 RepID=A0A6A6VW33_9PEZI|nr:uncharacterized protein EJ05DRAFT_505090 [Pseudovirgaria hyperparasitica]KAF2753451.1 hypothetical protein EJ05DRAFT_505090 [Pseudovirgaria hyperparasitica]
MKLDFRVDGMDHDVTITQRQKMPSMEGTPSRRAFMAMLWSCVAITFTFSVARIWIRIKIKHAVFADDFALVFGFICFLALAIIYQVAIDLMFGFGPQQSSETQAMWQTYQFALFMLFWTGLWSVKISILVFLRRFMNISIGRSMVYWWTVAGFTMSCLFVSFGLLFGVCGKTGDYFKPGKCHSEHNRSMHVVTIRFAGVADIVTDLAIMLLPWNLLWNLQINKRQKTALGIIFSLSFLVVVFAMLRLLNTRPETGHFSPVWVGVWSIWELNIAIIVGCLPSLRFLVTSRRHKRSGYGRQYAYGSSGSKRNPESSQDVPLQNFKTQFGSIANIRRGTPILPEVRNSQERIIPFGSIYVQKDIVSPS